MKRHSSLNPNCGPYLNPSRDAMKIIIESNRKILLMVQGLVIFVNLYFLQIASKLPRISSSFLTIDAYNNPYILSTILDQNMIAIAAHMMYDQFYFGLLILVAVSPESTVVSISISENLEFLDEATLSTQLMWQVSNNKDHLWGVTCECYKCLLVCFMGLQM
ncbi:hypothetical protein HanXRQr2_Chr01g0043721 [Helianthus annuus]|uniref:Transmembrane protein n=2 Tax=Helianthus annuus TaxID=4232 RepID=A0A9K3P4V0_HELAN|nr:uncharacterized protein LOC110936590 isoform X1 [Helianthus annuus]KAF5823939.1 hypothetical protein HanXRQr2_Chr01g0043721 [Helianthus annuus]KAJ0624930.1 hypothetical protein HanIR_Chr01g0048361 [Helianthus annuus]KAJ0628599.1 hypothetical protein HanHA89_Chr01g0038261 [Helianthus annuus]KAJ0784928.1 hypothetical protein HanLR1_Chr01g0037191 [Helianthus annuus]